ncbi:MAG: hypothetical protein OIF57_04130 [Marinobacterium sp.]|nr:hypothetical protein [Marinobacterium sp.]
MTVLSGTACSDSCPVKFIGTRQTTFTCMYARLFQASILSCLAGCAITEHYSQYRPSPPEALLENDYPVTNNYPVTNDYPATTP